MQTVPYPKSHILGYKQCLIGYILIINVCGYVYESCQLFVYGIIWRPYPVIIVIWAIHLYQRGMMCWYGIQITISISLVFCFMLVKCLPCAFHLAQFFFWSKITSLPITVQGVIPYKGALLTLPQFVNHTSHSVSQSVFVCQISSTGKG